jgi:salicylate hydroxylase
VHYPLRRGELYNLVAVFHSDRYVEGWNAKADANELWAHFNGQRPEGRTCSSASRPGACGCCAIASR